MIIMVMNREKLFQERHFIGYMSVSEYNYMPLILNNFEYMRRWNAEIDPNYKQPIPYCVVINPETKKIFVYKRTGAWSNWGESRLYDKYSWWVGGHVDKSDVESDDLVYDALLREIEEEINLKLTSEPKLVGFINLEHDVQIYHIWVMYIVETTQELVWNEWEIALHSFMSLEEAENLLQNPDVVVEDWSVVALQWIKEYLK